MVGNLKMLTIIKKDGHLSETVKTAFKHLTQWKRGDTYYISSKYEFTHYVESDIKKAIPALKHFGIKFKVKNEFPRGGKLGEYIEIDDKNAEKIALILQAYQ